MQQKHQELLLIRGIPGSGKSTLAKSMITHSHVEADMYFYDLQGHYNYDASKIKLAHGWCKGSTQYLLEQGRNVVVSNTFTRISEMQPYFDMAKQMNIPVRVIEAKGNFQNVHNVPDEVLTAMRERWELLPNDFLYGNKDQC